MGPACVWVRDWQTWPLGGTGRGARSGHLERRRIAWRCGDVDPFKTLVATHICFSDSCSLVTGLYVETSDKPPHFLFDWTPKQYNHVCLRTRVDRCASHLVHLPRPDLKPTKTRSARIVGFSSLAVGRLEVQISWAGCCGLNDRSFSKTPVLLSVDACDCLPCSFLQFTVSWQGALFNDPSLG